VLPGLSPVKMKIETGGSLGSEADSANDMSWLGDDGEY